MDWIGGLREAIVDPIRKDWGKAYALQKAARDRYPVADAAVNFVPYLGLATNAADGIEAASTGDKSAGLRVALDAGISAATTARYGLGTYKGAKYLATNPILNRPDRARKPGAVLSFPFVGAAASLPMAYANDIAKRQAYADVEYAGTPLRDIAKKKYPQFFE